MLCAMLLYARNGAFTVTAWPFWYSCVGRSTEPAGPVPLIPNRLFSWVASRLWPQPDSSIACAIVTAAGMPYCRCAASAPGATFAMNACRADESGADAVLGVAWLRLYRVPDAGWLDPAPDAGWLDPAPDAGWLDPAPDRLDRAPAATWLCRALGATEE